MREPHAQRLLRPATPARLPPNACLTCPDFQTTPEFLPRHRRQHDDTLGLLTAAEQAGNTRLATNHRQVAANLHQVITSLEAIKHHDDPDAC